MHTEPVEMLTIWLVSPRNRPRNRPRDVRFRFRFFSVSLNKTTETDQLFGVKPKNRPSHFLLSVHNPDYRTVGKLVNFTRRTDNYRFPLHELALSGQIYPWSVWSSSRCGIGATHTACSRACCLGWICNILALHSTAERQVRIEMIYIIRRSWYVRDVRRIYKYIVSLRQLWVCYKKRQRAARYYSSVATRYHNCVPVRIFHGRDLSNSSIILTSKGHTRMCSRFRLVSNKIRPTCVAPHVIYKRAQRACLTYHAACKVEFQPPICRTDSWRFSTFLFLKKTKKNRTDYSYRLKKWNISTKNQK